MALHCERAPHAAKVFVATLLVVGVVFFAVVQSGGSAPAMLTLDHALELALHKNEIPALARARIEQARSTRRQAIAALLPALSASATYTRRAREVTRTFGSQTATLQSRNALSGTLSAELDLLNASASPTLRATQRQVEAAEADALDLQRSLVFEVIESYFSVLAAERVAAAAATRVTAASDGLSQAQALLDVGLANRNHVTRMELELATARLGLTNALSAVEHARISLGYLMASPATGVLDEPAEFALPATSLALDATAVERRPDVLALRRQAEAARLLAQEPWLRHLPSLTASANWRQTNETGFSGHPNDWNVALVLRWTIYDAGRYADARMREAQADEARLALAARERAVMAEVRQALITLAAAIDAVRQAESRLVAARQNALEIGERFKAGLATALERSDATAALFEAEAELARQRLAYRLAQIDVLRTAGYPFPRNQGGE